MAGPTDHEQTPEGQIAALERAVSTLRAAGLPVDAVLERIASLREQISAAPAPGQVASVTEAAPAPGSTTIVQNIENHTGGNTFGHVHGHVTIGDDRSARDAAALHAYRRWVAAGCERLAMRLLAPEQNDASRSDETPELARVYVDLDTTTTDEGIQDGKPVGVQKGLRAGLGGSREKGPRRLSVLDVMAKAPRLVLLGQPGFGKSTLVQHTALCLACDAAAPEVGWDKLVSGLGCRGADMLPVVVLLRDLAASLPESSKGVEQRPTKSEKSGAAVQRGKLGQAERLPAASGEVLRVFLESRLRDAGLVDAIEPFWQALTEGTALVLLDGLDEVPTPEARQFLRDVVNAFERLYPKCRYLVTCRVLTWAQEKLSLRGFDVTEIAPFDATKIQRFIGAWHAELVRLGRMDAATAGRLGPKLLDAIRERPGLAVLAQTPLLLTVMAVVHTKGGQLPEGEALLYREAVEVLLWRWQDTVSAQSPRTVLDEVGARDGDLLDVLRRLAFTVHGRTPVEDGATDDGAGGVADIAETELLEALMTLDPDESRQWARRLVDALKARAGLLLERAPRLYTFPHRTFQELLAGWHLSLQGDFEVQAASLLQEDATRWRKAVLLATGLLAAEPRLSGLKVLLDELCPPAAEDTEGAWREAWWAGEVLEVVGARRLGGLRAARVERVRDRLCALVEGGKLAPRERVEAGRLLGRLGDPRFRDDAWRLPVGETGGFVRIPAGPFWMGSDKGVDEEAYEEAYDDELPRHEVTVPEVWMARYPVTVGQWRAFVRASGFQPGDEDSLMGVDNEPVRWVSWHEAVAYAQWLDGELRASPDCPRGLKSLLGAGHHVKLPSEAEWEKAARGTDGRLWPWGQRFEKERLTGANLGLSDVSPVGCFPTGATPEGLLDMAGNVWEWTRSALAGYPYLSGDGREELGRQETDRVLRGGSFDSGRRNVRCACRGVNDPGARGVVVGFRLLLSPF